MKRETGKVKHYLDWYYGFKKGKPIAKSDIGHAIACAAHDLLEVNQSPKNIDKIWNSNARSNQLLVSEALWQVTWDFLTDRDNGTDITVT